MNKKRTVSIRHPQLVRFRKALREIIFRAKLVEVRKLLDGQKDLDPIYSDTDRKQMKFLSDKRDKLATAWKKSLYMCSLFGSSTNDMTFNTYFKEWFYVNCYKKK